MQIPANSGTLDFDYTACPAAERVPVASSTCVLFTNTFALSLFILEEHSPLTVRITDEIKPYNVYQHEMPNKVLTRWIL